MKRENTNFKKRNLIFRKIRALVFLVFILWISYLPQRSFSQSGNCSQETPFFVANLVGNPSGTWVSAPPVSRDGYCCGASGANKCIEFEITLDPNAVALSFNIASGAIPSGSMYYQINCGPQVAVGQPICLTTPGPHTITFCKPGNNVNTYAITSIIKPYLKPLGGYATTNCADTLHVYGLVTNTITWNDITYGGTYNSYLNCSSSCNTVVVKPQPGFPPYVDYLVCGEVLAPSCYGNLSFCDTIRVYFYDKLQAAITPNPVSICAGNGGVSLTGQITGGVPPYSYFWTDGANGSGNVVSNNLNYFATSSSTYSFVVRDSTFNRCSQVVANVPVSFNPSPIISVTPSSINVCEGTTVEITASGAESYLWMPNTGIIANSGATITVSNSSNIDYIVIGTNSFGCHDTAFVTYSVNPNPTALITDVSNVSCFGGNNGSLTVTANGGTAPYAGIGTFTVSAGIHNYTVTDANGCIATTSITVTEPTALTASSTSGTILCNGGTTTITVTANGGTAPYTGTGTFTVGAGTHNYTVTDANGCTANTSITITEPTILTAASTSGAISCNGGTTTVTVTANGGTAPYTGIGTFTVSAGTHNYTVTDANGCIATTSITVTEPTALTATSTSGAISCYGGTATVTVTANGGTAPYTGIGTFTVSAGIHNYTVTDANGCIATTSITVTEPTALTAASTSGVISCNGGTTTITVTANGGTAPYTGVGSFTVSAGINNYTVTDANGCIATTSITVTEPTALTATSTSGVISCNGGTTTITVTANGGTAPYTGTGTFNVGAGTHNYTVTDANGCTANTSITITEPTALTASSTSGVISCNGGTTTITVTANGGTAPYTGIGAFTVSAGIHNYSVTDANGCVATTSITVTEPTVLTASSTSGTILCNGGTTIVTVTANGGTAPYTGIGTYTVGAGTHNYTVTDANGCTANTSITITEPAALTAASTSGAISCNGGTTTVTVTANGGTVPYTGIGTYTVGAGTHNYTMTDANGCIATTSITVTEPTALTASSTSGTILCNGGTTTITVTANGGTAPYTGIGTFTVSAGIHNYTVNDANGCIATTSITVTEPTALTAASTSGAISCNGGTTTVNVTANGGVAPYTGIGTFTVSAGINNYTVTDANGCIATTSITVTEPTALTAASTSGTILCNGGTTTITVTANGGTAPYTGIGTYTVGAGTHNYTVTDANGCIATTSITVTEPTALTASSTSGAISCNGGTTTLTVTANGGTAPYTGTGTFNVGAGTHNYTVTDANGCTANTSITITEPTALTASSTSGAISCNGGTTTVTVTANGGTAPYTGIGTYTVGAGTHNYTVTDANGCAANTSITITEPTVLTASSTSGTISCYGGTTTITVTANGGTAPYTGIGAFTVSAGTHNYTVTDANGCIATTSITVTEPTALTASSTSGTILCNGGTTTITVTANGGTAPYNYLWPSGNTSAMEDNLFAGTYVVSVTDNNSCTMAMSIIINQPIALSSSITNLSNVSCFGGNNGSATVAGNGGTGSYNYLWPSGNTSATENNLYAGTYTVTITDINNCISNATAIITEAPQLIVNLSHTDIFCHGANDGSAFCQVSGGNAPYTYLWSSGAITQSIFNLDAGQYFVTVTDHNNCEYHTSVNIEQPFDLQIHVDNISNVLCYSGNNGSVTVSANGGLPPYTFLWSNGATGNTVSALPAGIYYVNVSDANGCSRQDTIIISQPPALLLNVTQNDTLCLGSLVNISATASGGNPDYIYYWDNNLGNGNNYSITVGDYNVYHVYAVDSNGCTTAIQEIAISHYPVLQVYASVNNGNPICSGDSTTINLIVTGPLSDTNPYTWNNGLGHSIPPVEVSPSTTTQYIVTVSGLCGSVIDTLNLVVSPLPEAHVELNHHFGCDSYNASFYENSNPPLNHYSWNFGDPSSGVNNNSDMQNPAHFYENPGVYDVSLIVQNEFGCSRTYLFNDMISVYPKPKADFEVHPSYISVEDGKAKFVDFSSDAYHWFWDFGDPNSGPMNHSTDQHSSHVYTEVGFYTVWLIIENENGCRDSVSKVIEVHDYYTFYAPNAFSPNDDGDNDKFIPRGINWQEGSFEFYVYDRWGKLVYTTKDPEAAWDGKVDNKEIAPEGVYSWLVYVKDNRGLLRKYIGSVIIL